MGYKDPGSLSKGTHNRVLLHADVDAQLTRRSQVRLHLMEGIFFSVSTETSRA